MIVTSYLMGGLGNQLFQIFTTLSYGLEHKKKLFYPIQKQVQGA